MQNFGSDKISMQNEIELTLRDRKYEKSLTHLMSVVGRYGTISAQQIKSIMRKENPEHGGRYIEVILNELTPSDTVILNKRLFSWHDLLYNPTATKDKLKKKLNYGNDISLIHEIKESTNLSHALLQINQGHIWTRFEIDYYIGIKKGEDNPKGQINEIEKVYKFIDDKFKVTYNIDGKELSGRKSFYLKRKNGKLYVYTVQDSDPNLRTYLNRKIDRNKFPAIEKYLANKVIEYIRHNRDLILFNISRRQIRISGKNNKIYKHIFGPRAFPIVKSIIAGSNLKESEGESVNKVLQSISSHVVNEELHKLNQKYWLYSLNMRGFMRHFVLLESTNKINEVISALCKSPSYNHINDSKTGINDLDFPFLLYHNDIMKILPQNYTGSELKRITKKLEGLIDCVSLHELNFLVTYEYFKDFQLFMHNKSIIITQGSVIEHVKTSNPILYLRIIDYQINILKYIASYQEEQLRNTKSTLALVEETQSHMNGYSEINF